MPKRGRTRKKNRTHVRDNETAQSALTEKQDEKVPKSLVLRRGKTASVVGELVEDLRHLMLPYTALHFKEDPKNRKLTMAQYATHLALPMGITHLLCFSQNDERLFLRLARTPQGPTLSFRVHQFTLNRHIKKLQKRPVSYTESLTENPPLVVTNNFGDASAAAHLKLLRITFQNLFPAINVSTVKLAECRRVVLFNLIEQPAQEEEGKEQTNNDEAKPPQQFIEMRHFAIKATPVGVNRRVRRLVVKDKIPNLNKCQDIADYLGDAILSDAPSDSEPEEDVTLNLPDSYVGKGNHKSQKSALKLVEIGPRLTLELFKVEKGLGGAGGADVLYHAYNAKSPQEAAALKERKDREKELKQQRRAQQEQNVERKRKLREEKRQAKKQRQAEREQRAMEQLRSGQQLQPQNDDNDSDDNSASTDASGNE